MEYAEVLSRLRLHTCAAYIRKFVPVEDIRATTSVREMSTRCVLIMMFVADDNAVANDHIYRVREVSQTTSATCWAHGSCREAVRELQSVQGVSRQHHEVLHMVRSWFLAQQSSLCLCAMV